MPPKEADKWKKKIAAQKTNTEKTKKTMQTAKDTPKKDRNANTSKAMLAIANDHMDLLSNLSNTFNKLMTAAEEEEEASNHTSTPSAPPASRQTGATAKLPCPDKIDNLLHTIKEDIMRVLLEWDTSSKERIKYLCLR